MKEFKDKVAVITGAADGIGKAIAERCVQEGIKLVLADINAEALKNVEKELKGRDGDVITVLTDVSKAKDVEALAKKTIEKYGEVHLLFNNAGVVVGAPLWEHTLADWKWMIGVNLWGIIHGIKYFIPIMIEQDNECHIINISSLAGLCSGEIGLGIYATTKHSVVALSETLQKELKSLPTKIKVGVACPGFTKTKIIDAERNRPAELCNNPSEIIKNPEHEKIKDFIFALVNGGYTAEEVADVILEGIKEEKFYILMETTPFYKKIIKDRFKNIMDSFPTKRK